MLIAKLNFEQVHRNKAIALGYLYGSEGLFALVIRTDGRDSVRYCHHDHLGNGEGLMALGGSLKTGAKIAVQSVDGGTLSELGGGNFANGAITAAFSFLFNDVMHDNGNSEDSDSDFEVEIEVPIDVESQPSQLTEILAGATLILIADDGTVIGL